MTTSASMPVEVRVVGIVRGREIDAVARVFLDDAALVLEWPNAAAWRLALDGIDGIGTGTLSCTVYLPEHDVLELTAGESLHALAMAVTERACRMPELTRGLRDLGAVLRGGPIAAGVTSPLHTAHDRWFAPLLSARRVVHGVSDPQRQVMLLDGASLQQAMLEAAGSIATTLAPGDHAEQRALEAAIEDEAHPMFVALEHLRLAGETVRTGQADSRFADWRRWVHAARTVFEKADEGWAGIAEIVGES